MEPSLTENINCKRVWMDLHFDQGEDVSRKYEGASHVTGTYRGKHVTGYCCLELVGGWKA